MINIEARSYNHLVDNQAIFIHRYYLSRSERSQAQPADVAAIKAWKLLENNDSSSHCPHQLRDESYCITYRKEQLTRLLPSDTVATVLHACTAYHTDLCNHSSLTADDSAYLMELNAELGRYEQALRTELAFRSETLDQEQRTGSRFVQDYELETRISYLLAEDDPLYEDDDDNILYTCRYHVNPIHHDLMSEEPTDWNDKRAIASLASPVWKVPHCWLFHDLEDHSPVPMKFIRRIGTIWTDIVLCYQNFITISPVTLGRR